MLLVGSMFYGIAKDRRSIDVQDNFSAYIVDFNDIGLHICHKTRCLCVICVICVPTQLLPSMHVVFAFKWSTGVTWESSVILAR